MQTDLQETSRFLVRNEKYYSREFLAIERKIKSLRPNFGALLAGPLWAAARGVWWLFWVSLIFDVGAVAFFFQARLQDSVQGLQILLAIFLFIGSRVGVSLIANRALLAKYEKWRLSPSAPSGFSWRRILFGIFLAIAIAPLTIYRTLRTAPSERDCRSILGKSSEFLDSHGFLQMVDCLTIGAVPINRERPQAIASSIDRGVEYLTVNFSGFFDSVAWAVRTVLVGLENLFIGIPWPVMIVLLILASWRVAGVRVAIFTTAALAYLASMGFWQNAMATISLVSAAVTIAVIIGVPLGIWAAKSARANSIIHPTLDVMQTLPSFVYLIPAIAFFSIGKTPAVLATVIYACPPLIKLTALGIRQVSPAVTEAAIAFGATPLQLLLKAELPLAMSSIMTGVNQSIMMSLAMSVIAALIGAGGLGFDVLFSLQQVQPGKGLLAGIAIALCAMIIDRSVQGMRRAGAH
jgi:glycine betaine/proline transport system permease protein